MTLFDYDSQGRLISQTAPDGGITSYEYTAAGKLLKVTDPDDGEIEYDVNANGYDVGVKDAMGYKNTTLRETYEGDKSGGR